MSMGSNVNCEPNRPAGASRYTQVTSYRLGVPRAKISDYLLCHTMVIAQKFISGS